MTARLEAEFAQAMASCFRWEKEGEALAVYADVPKPRPLERAIREAVEAVTGFNVVVRCEARAGGRKGRHEDILGGRPVNGEAAPIEGLERRVGRRRHRGRRAEGGTARDEAYAQGRAALGFCVQPSRTTRAR